MKKKLLEAIEAFGENIDKVTTTASIHLFIVTKQEKQIDEDKRKIFH